MRRNNWKVTRAANFSMMCLRTQLDNAHALENSQVLTYESLVQNPALACEPLATFMPALEDMDSTASFEVDSIDGTLNRPITDLNTKKIASLPANTISSMNEIFIQHRETIEAWGYDLLNSEPGEQP